MALVDDTEVTQLMYFLRSLSPVQLDVYGRMHPSTKPLVDDVQAEREIREALMPTLVERLGEEMADAAWLTAVQLDDHQAALHGADSTVTAVEILEAAIDIVRRQFDNYESDGQDGD